MTLPPRRIPATLADHHGELVDRDEAPLLWLGDATPDLMASLMRSASLGPLRVYVEDRSEQTVWIQRCWFDMGEGKMVVQLSERGAPS